MTSDTNLCLPVGVFSFIAGIVLGLIIARLPKRQALVGLIIPVVILVGTFLVYPDLVVYVLTFGFSGVFGMLVAFALVVASGRKLFDK